jgi:predicted phosphatase
MCLCSKPQKWNFKEYMYGIKDVKGEKVTLLGYIRHYIKWAKFYYFNK